MWGKSRKSLPLLAALLFLSPVLPRLYSSDAIDPAQVEAWAEGKTQAELKIKLIWLTGIFNRLDSLYQADKIDWMKTNEEVKNDLKSAKSSLTKLETDFNLLQTMQEEKKTQIDNERKTWRVLAFAASGALLGAVGGVQSAGVGLCIGGVAAIVWGLFD